MVTQVDVRAEQPEDRDAIRAVTEAAFREAPYSDHTEPFIVKALRETGALTISLVAEVGGLLVGHVAVSPVTISDGSPGWFGLGPISVLPECQGRGIGSRLLHAALEALRARDASGCVVLGEPAYYGRFGFRLEPQLKFPQAPAEYFQAISFGPPIPHAIVAYHKAFGATE
jgi:putative acetyltransferase